MTPPGLQPGCRVQVNDLRSGTTSKFRHTSRRASLRPPATRRTRLIRRHGAIDGDPWVLPRTQASEPPCEKRPQHPKVERSHEGGIELRRRPHGDLRIADDDGGRETSAERMGEVEERSVSQGEMADEPFD